MASPTLRPDTTYHQGLRRRLVEELRGHQVFDEKILDALSRIPRHQFIDDAFQEWAYRDVPFPIGSDQTISQPYTVAAQTQLLRVQPGLKILEIGTGSGYQAAVLHLLGARVYTIERQEGLFHHTRRLLERMGYGAIRTRLGDGYAGLPLWAPFDRIIITCGAVEIPETLVEQLAPTGIMVVPYGSQASGQEMLRIIKSPGGHIHRESHGQYRFVPMLKGVQRSGN